MYDQVDRLYKTSKIATILPQVYERELPANELCDDWALMDMVMADFERTESPLAYWYQAREPVVK